MKKFLIAAAIAAAAPAFAQTATPSQFYIGVDGVSQRLKSTDDLPGGPTGPAALTESKTTARLFGGYQITPNWAVELGYGSTRYSVNVDDIDERSTGNLRLKGLDLGVTYKFTQGLPGFFVKAGLSRFKAEASGSGTDKGTNAPFTISGSESGTGPMFGFGYEANLTGNLDGRVGYTQYNKVAGDSDVKLRMLYVGLKYRF